MKYPKVQLIIDHLHNLDNSETSPMGFDMSASDQQAGCTDHPCGSACCIGGHANLLLDDAGQETYSSVDMALARYCDIPEEDAVNICWPGMEWDVGQYSNITLPIAIAALERYRDTGIVDWSEVEKYDEV